MATFVLLDAICQNDEPNDNSHGAIQKPNVGMVLEDFGADQNGKSHDAPHQRVKSYEKGINSIIYYFLNYLNGQH